MDEAYAKIVHATWAAMSEATMPQMDDFKTKPLIGKWTLKHKGIAQDAVAGVASGFLATSFCRNRGEQLMMRFDLSAHGGAANCGILARAFCHRMQHFFNAELSDPRIAGKPFPDAVIDAYKEPSEFIKFAATPLLEQTAKRIKAIRGLFC